MTDNHTLYRQYCEEIFRRQMSNVEAQDKAILSLSSAGLALSLTFFQFIVPIHGALALGALKAAWVLFCLSIASTICSFITSQQALKRALKDAEQYYLHDDESYENKHNAAADLTVALNHVGAVLFIIAITCVVYFVIQNMGGESIALSHPFQQSGAIAHDR